MFKTIEEGIEVYKNEFRAYLGNLASLKKIAGGDVHYQFVRDGGIRLEAMEKVLGLSWEEKKQIEEEIEPSSEQ